jgi:hypothetical protein
MAEVETMLQLGGQALLDAAEFVLLRNMLRRVIKPPNRSRISGETEIENIYQLIKTAWAKCSDYNIQ